MNVMGVDSGITTGIAITNCRGELVLAEQLVGLSRPATSIEYKRAAIRFRELVKMVDVVAIEYTHSTSGTHSKQAKEAAYWACMDMAKVERLNRVQSGDLRVIQYRPVFRIPYKAAAQDVFADRHPRYDRHEWRHAIDALSGALWVCDGEQEPQDGWQAVQIKSYEPHNQNALRMRSLVDGSWIAAYFKPGNGSYGHNSRKFEELLVAVGLDEETAAHSAKWMNTDWAGASKLLTEIGKSGAIIQAEVRLRQIGAAEAFQKLEVNECTE